MPGNEALIEFADDLPPTEGDGREQAWTLLVVDDDEEVHEATRFALRHLQLCGRPVCLVHAHSASEAAACLAREPDVAVILLDVVMESHDAGLQLVRHIRDAMHRRDVRIILRTGQPGYAPELKVIRDYDINDYKTKAELTHTRLVTMLTVAVRAYQQIREIADNRRGLELIVVASADLMEARALTQFAEGVLTQIASLLHLPGDGIVCAQKGSPLDAGDRDGLHVVAAAGRLAPCIAQPLERLAEPGIVAAIRDCIAAKAHVFAPQHTVLYLRGSEHEAAVYVRGDVPLAASDRRLVEVFAANLSSCFGNIKLVERLNHLAYHDLLTGLGNRVRFLADLAEAGAEGDGQVACLLDLDRFTDVNNALGHEVGDQLLLAVAARLREDFPGCRLARVDADSFGLVGPGTLLTRERVFAALEAPFAAGEQQLAISATLGRTAIVAGESGNVLFRRAEMALTQARLSQHARCCDFAPEMEARTRWRLELIRHLRHDFFAHRLAVWYQPQVALAGDGLVGFEALLRWPGADDDFVYPPAVFIPLAEDSGLITEIGAWVLDQACATLHRLRTAGAPGLRMAVNVSMPQFRLADFPAAVARVLAAHGLPPDALELEITESVLMEEPDVVLANLRTLRQSGVQISVDDFGTGYSSLGYLRELPIDALKIDRSFVVEIDSGRGDLFVETIVAFARKLGVTTIAEGVDSAAQVARLRELGCDVAQGFLYARPMPPAALDAWIAGRPAGGSPAH